MEISSPSAPPGGRSSFSKCRTTRASNIWRLGFEQLRVPWIFDLLADPFERGDSSMLYDQWLTRASLMIEVTE